MNLSVLGIFLGIAFLIVFALRGYHILILAPIAAIIVAVFSNMNIGEALTVEYMKGFASYASKFYLILLLASIFAKYMDDSGAGRSIAKMILKLIGKDKPVRVIFALSVIFIVLTYGGVNLFAVIFIGIALALPLFREMDIPWPLFLATLALGIGTLSLSMIPGTPAVTNIIPTKYLGTSLTAAPLVGIVAAIACLAFDMWYINKQLKKYKEKGIGFEEPNIKLSSDVLGKGEKDPHWIMSLIPPIFLLTLINIVKLDIIYSLILSIILCAIVYFKKVNNHMKTLNEGALNSVTPVVNVSADVGFATVVAAAAGFEVISNFLINIPGNPLFSLAISTNLMSAITGSSSGGLGVAMEVLSKKYLAMGISPELLHRIGAIASGGLDNMPHSGGVIMLLAVTGLTHKNGYKHLAMTAIVGPLISLVPAILVGILLY